MYIECKNLTKHYESDHILVKAVDNVSLTVEAGDFVVILGHSGSGKTTLLSLIGGLTKPEKGTVLINNQDNWQQSDRALSRLRNTITGFIFQFASLIPTLTVIENILLPLSFSDRTDSSRDYALHLLDRVGLLDKQNSFPGQLSGGQQRRIAIARAFVNKPKIILADEPTGDLDEETEHEILQIFNEFHQQGTTFLVVTHNSGLAATQVNPSVYQMKQGRISGPKEHHST